MCMCTHQASVTYNWRVSDADTGPKSVHPQHGLSAPVTGRICVSTSIFIMWLTQRFGNDDCLMADEWLSGLSWITLHHSPDQGCLVCTSLTVAVVDLIRIHWLFSASLQRGLFFGQVKMFPSLSVAGRYVYTWLNKAHLLSQLSATCLFCCSFLADPVPKCSTWDPSAWTQDPSSHEIYLSLLPLTKPQESPVLLHRRNHCTIRFEGKVLALSCCRYVCESTQNCLTVQTLVLLHHTAHECLLTWGKVLLITSRFHSH